MNNKITLKNGIYGTKTKTLMFILMACLTMLVMTFASLNATIKNTSAETSETLYTLKLNYGGSFLTANMDELNDKANLQYKISTIKIYLSDLTSITYSNIAVENTTMTNARLYQNGPKLYTFYNLVENTFFQPLIYLTPLEYQTITTGSISITDFEVTYTFEDTSTFVNGLFTINYTTTKYSAVLDYYGAENIYQLSVIEPEPEPTPEPTQTPETPIDEVGGFFDTASTAAILLLLGGCFVLAKILK